MDRLSALLATLLPGDADWPAGDIVAAQVALDAQAAPDALDAVLAALPPGFARGDEAALREVEAAHLTAFAQVVTLAYLAYYTDPAIRRVIQRMTGYEARPPQPDGYALPPFDPALLDAQRRRPPFWRNPDTDPIP